MSSQLVCPLSRFCVLAIVFLGFIVHSSDAWLCLILGLYKQGPGPAQAEKGKKEQEAPHPLALFLSLTAKRI